MLLNSSPIDLATVARTVNKAEYNAQPDARAALDKEWRKLENIGGSGTGAWDLTGVREWTDVREESSDDLTRIHIGSLHELCVQKGSELPDGDPNKKYKGRVVFLGDRVLDGFGNCAVFEELSSSPASMEAGKFCDLWGCLPGHTIQSADGNQAYCQSSLKGTRKHG